MRRSERVEVSKGFYKEARPYSKPKTPHADPPNPAGSGGRQSSLSKQQRVAEADKAVKQLIFTSPDFAKTRVAGRDERKRHLQAKRANRDRLRTCEERDLPQMRRDAAAYRALVQKEADDKMRRARVLKHARKSANGDAVIDNKLEVGALSQFSADDMATLDTFIYQHSISEKDGVLTRQDIKEHIERHYAVTVTVNQVSHLMEHLNYTYGSIVPGYYYSRASDEKTFNHRKRLMPLLEFIMTHGELFLVFFHDEKAFRRVSNAKFKWNKDNDAYHKFDTTHEPGTGNGYNVSAGISRELGIVMSADGTFVGYKKSTQKKESRETANKSSASAKKKTPARKQVKKKQKKAQSKKAKKSSKKKTKATVETTEVVCQIRAFSLCRSSIYFSQPIVRSTRGASLAAGRYRELNRGGASDDDEDVDPDDDVDDASNGAQHSQDSSEAYVPDNAKVVSQATQANSASSSTTSATTSVAKCGTVVADSKQKAQKEAEIHVEEGGRRVVERNGGRVYWCRRCNWQTLCRDAERSRRRRTHHYWCV